MGRYERRVRTINMPDRLWSRIGILAAIAKTDHSKVIRAILNKYCSLMFEGQNVLKSEDKKIIREQLALILNGGET